MGGALHQGAVGQLGQERGLGRTDLLHGVCIPHGAHASRDASMTR